MSERLSEDIDRILQWGSENLVDFNSSKTQHLTISTKKSQVFPSVAMGCNVLEDSSAVSILGLRISSHLSWNDHINSIAKRASQKLGYLFRARGFFSSRDLLLLYKAQVRPLMEYCSHIWGGAPATSLKILDKVQARAIRLINDVKLTSSLQPLSHRRAVASLSLFYRYFFGACSSELSGCVPPPLELTANRTSRQTLSSHPYAVVVPTCRTAMGKQSFFMRTARLWNALPSTCFPGMYGLQKFKQAINKQSHNNV